MEEIKTAHDMAPLSLVINLSYSRSFLLADDYENCMITAKDQIDLYPRYASHYVTLGYALLGQNKNDEAVAAFEKAVDLERTGQTLSALGFAYAISGKPSKAITLVKELEQRYPSHKALGREIAAVYAGLGNYDKTFSWLEADLRSRSTELSTIRYLPPFRSMRNTPQFQDLLSRMGLSSKLD